MQLKEIDGIDYFIDLQPKIDNFRKSVLAGLSRPQKSISPKFFYNKEGSELFDRICDTPEYYITRTELELMHDIREQLNSLVRPGSIVIEYGCGTSKKIRELLSSISNPSEYIGIDISKDYLITTVKQIAKDFPDIRTGAICADFLGPLNWPESANPDDSLRLAFFPGSTIGNQTPQEAIKFLKHVRRLISKRGYLLIGVDLKKDISLLNRAYNDGAGYTADFNLNLLYRMKNELGVQIDISTFSHNAFYNVELARVEMHLISNVKQVINIGGMEILFEKGESIHTENSYKYSNNEFVKLAEKSGFGLVKLWNDADELFSVYYFRAI